MVERQRVAITLIAGGWLLLLGYSLIVISHVDQAREFGDFVDGGGFAGRASVLAQLTVPSYGVLLVLAAAAAVAAQLLRTGYGPSRWPAVPLAWMTVVTALGAAVVALLGMWSITQLDEGPAELGQFASYAGGVAVLAAAVAVAVLAMRLSPAPPADGVHHPNTGHHRPMSPFAQPPSSPSR